MTELPHWSAAQVARAIRSGKLSAVEVTRAALERIERLNSQLNAFITVTADEALQQARAVDRRVRAGEQLPLAGVPLAVKDLFATKGVRTTSGSKLHEDYVPTNTAPVVEQLLAAGAVMVGKTNLHEFAFGFTNLNPHFGNARNPWDPNCVTGGSSGGSAAAVAAGLAPLALGTDTGGSIRLPAALCGHVGFKPTLGLVSRRGVTPLAWTFDHVGPMTRTVEDAAHMLEIMAGRKLKSPKLHGLRLGIPDDYFLDEADPEVAEAVLAATRVLRTLGVKLSKVKVPHTEIVIGAHRAIIFSEAAAVHRANLRSRLAEYGPDLRANLLAGLLIPAPTYVTAQRARRRIIAEWRDLFGCDALAMPTALRPAIAFDRLPVIRRGESRPLARQYVGNTCPFNLTGQPALSVPCGFTRDGLPIGLQLVGRVFDDALVLALGRAYQRATEWHTTWPAL